jgi:tetratricopeptide (TPR) repeat protein
LGHGLVGKGFYAHAELAFRQAVRQDQPALPAQFGLAFSLDRMGRLSESAKEYGRVVTLPRSAPDDELTQNIALYAQGKNALRSEDQASAIAYFRQNGNFTAAVYQHAKILVRSERAEEALPLIDEVLTILPYSLEFHFLRFRALRALGRDREAFQAATMVERSAHLVSLNYSTQYVMPLDRITGAARLLGQLNEIAGDKDLSRFDQQLRDIKRLTGDQPIFALRVVDEQLLQAAVRSGDSQQAREIITKLRDQGMENEWILEAEGDLWDREGETEKAAKNWQRALLLTPKVSLHRKLAAHFGDGQPQKRDYHLGHAALLDGIAAYRKNQLAAALQPLKLASELLADQPTPWYYIGEMHFHLGQTRQATEAYQKCLAIWPNHSRAIAKLDYLKASEKNK